VKSAPIPGVERLEAAGPALVREALWSLLLASLLTAVVVVGFDWGLDDMVGGTLVGIAVFGAVKYGTETRHAVPHGSLLEAPPGIEPRPAAVTASGALILVMALALCVPLAWLADRWDLGAVFIPGQMAGYAAADLLSAALIGRWERTNGRRVLVDPDEYGSEVRPYAGPPL
jgi:hypothetical protein